MVAGRVGAFTDAWVEMIICISICFPMKSAMTAGAYQDMVDRHLELGQMVSFLLKNL